ncbi:MAG: MarC family protein [Polyangiaceae bacterium]|nr:MarC family protein [Polyangiaceae bacterium]
MHNEFFESFIVLWSVIDPIGTIPVFVDATHSLNDQKTRRIRNRAVLIAAGLLTLFAVFGQVALEGMGIPLAAFQTAGGIVLFLFALTMIFGDSKPEEESKLKSDVLQLAVFPIAIPSLASPGALLGIVMLTDNHRHAWPSQLFTLGLAYLVLLTAWILMLLAEPIFRKIGRAGASLVSRIMGLILSAVAANAVLEGIRDYFQF